MVDGDFRVDEASRELNILHATGYDLSFICHRTVFPMEHTRELDRYCS